MGTAVPASAHSKAAPWAPRLSVAAWVAALTAQRPDTITGSVLTPPRDVTGSLRAPSHGQRPAPGASPSPGALRPRPESPRPPPLR